MKSIKVSSNLWDEIMQVINDRLKRGSLNKPIVFALYTKEDNHYGIIDFKEITTVQVTGDYPKGKYTYHYPGIKQQGFYPRKGEGKWFSGTLVVGDNTELDEGDKKWMIRDKMDFRIKMDRDSKGQLSCKAYYIDFFVGSLDLQ